MREVGVAVQGVRVSAFLVTRTSSAADARLPQSGCDSASEVCCTSDRHSVMISCTGTTTELYIYRGYEKSLAASSMDMDNDHPLGLALNHCTIFNDISWPKATEFCFGSQE